MIWASTPRLAVRLTHLPTGISATAYAYDNNVRDTFASLRRRALVLLRIRLRLAADPPTTREVRTYYPDEGRIEGDAGPLATIALDHSQVRLFEQQSGFLMHGAITGMEDALHHVFGIKGVQHACNGMHW